MNTPGPADSLRALAGLIDKGIIPADHIDELTVFIDASLDVNQTLTAKIAISAHSLHGPEHGNYAKRSGLTDVVRSHGTVDAVRVVLQVPAGNLGREVPVTSNVVRLDERITKVIA